MKNSSYAKTGGLFYKWAMAASENGDHFPIWGTCLGFELLIVITAGDSYLTSCKSSGRALPLTFRSSEHYQLNIITGSCIIYVLLNGPKVPKPADSMEMHP